MGYGTSGNQSRPAPSLPPRAAAAEAVSRCRLRCSVLDGRKEWMRREMKVRLKSATSECLSRILPLSNGEFDGQIVEMIGWVSRRIGHATQDCNFGNIRVVRDVSSPRDKMTSPRLSSMDGFRAPRPRSKIDSLLLRPSLHDGETQKWFGGKEFDERASKRPPLSLGRRFQEKLFWASQIHLKWIGKERRRV